MYFVSRHVLTLQLQNNLRPTQCAAVITALSHQNYSKGPPRFQHHKINKRQFSSCMCSANGKHFRDSKCVTDPVNPSHLSKDLLKSNQTLARLCRHYSQAAEQQVIEKKSSGDGDNPPEVSSSRSQSTSEASGPSDSAAAAFDDVEAEQELSLTDEEIQILSNGNPELIKKIKYIQLEHSVFKQEGYPVPMKVSMKHWAELLPLDTRSKRKRFFEYLFKSEMKELSQRRKKVEKMERRLKEFEENPLPTKEDDEYGMTYVLNRNTLFLRLYDTTMNKFYNNRLASAALHSPPLILDCSYTDHMNIREQKNCAKQLEFLVAENRVHRDPFNLYFCNLHQGTPLRDFLYRFMPNMAEDNCVINVHEQSFMDLFPPERLVYLTPHTREDLVEYNDDDIYIIGAMVDKTDCRPYSMAKAKKLNIRMKRLPLDDHVIWGLGTKSLTVNAVGRIMLDVRYSRGDWKHAFLKNLPWRKLNRDYHPYPNQPNEDGVGRQNDEPMQALPQRKERRSMVLEDYELLNRRKGFRRSDMHTPRPHREEDFNGQARAPKMRSLLYDED